MSEWSSERLDALPLWTVIEYRMRAGHPAAYRAVKTDDDLDCWHLDRAWETSAWMAQQHDIRVVSVPVETLLSKETEDALFYVGAGGLRDYSVDLKVMRATLRAAVAHVTGEQS